LYGIQKLFKFESTDLNKEVATSAHRKVHHTVETSTPHSAGFLYFNTTQGTNSKNKMSRSIPFNRIQTFFYSNDGTSPQWFQNDSDMIETCLFSNINLGLEWVQRRRDAGMSYRRAIASDETGTTYWLHDQHGLIRLDAFGNPDFVSTSPLY
jgi:hypothetical protein